MNFCTQCGEPVSLKIPQGDTLPRHVCDACNTIHYQNPKIVAGCIPEWEGKVLLCERAIEPRTGYWTFPAGFMELEESTEEAASRETREEANAEVDIEGLFALYTLTRVSQVYVVYRGTLREGRFGIGAESSDAQLVTIDNIPWDNLAFPVIKEVLQRYVQDYREGTFRVHCGVIQKRWD